MPTVTLDEHRITHVDGRPFFLIGARHVPAGGTAALLREAGFNGVRVTAFGTETYEPEPIPDDLDGMFIWSYLFDRADLTKPGHERQLRDWITELRGHPALLCYENYNEPTLGRTRFKAEPEDLAAGSDLVRELDPDHPLWLAHSCSNTIETLARFNGSADIVGCNPYPVFMAGMRRHIGMRDDGLILDCPDQTVHAVGRYTQKMMAVGRGRPVWMLIQALANENWYHPNYTVEQADAGVEQGKILYPTFAQMRFMAFDAIVHGATGLALSMYRTPVDSAIWHDIVKLVGQLRDLHEALAAPPVLDAALLEYTDLGHTIWDGVQLLMRRTADDLYVFAVNTTFDPVQVAIQLPVEPASPVQVVHEDRQLVPQGNRIADRFAAHGVHVYRVPGCSIPQ